MHPQFSQLTQITTALVAVTLALAAVTLIGHALNRGRATVRATQSRALARIFARLLTGEIEPAQLQLAAGAVPGDVFWTAIEMFSDNIGGPEWVRLSAAVRTLPVVGDEQRR